MINFFNFNLTFLFYLIKLSVCGSLNKERKMTDCEKKSKTMCIIKGIVLLLVLVASITSAVFSYKAYEAVSSAPAANGAAPKVAISKKYAKNKTFEKAQKAQKPTAVLFYVDWCGYCQRFAPMFNEITKKRSFKSKYGVAFVNCEDPQNRELVKEYDIKGFPTLYFVNFKNGDRLRVENSLLFRPDAEKNLLELFENFLKGAK